MVLGKNTNTNLAALDITVKIQNTLDANLLSAGLFIDLAKAFDTVSHKLLLKKLENLGFQNNALKWMESYLEGRKQYVEFENDCSSLEETPCGVPQGSILGPLLFIIFINDLMVLKLKGEITLFADDTNLFYFGQTDEEILTEMEEDMEVLMDWMESNGLFINLEKTQFMIFKKPATRTSNLTAFTFRDYTIQRTDAAIFLGLLIDENLVWDKHIGNICKKIARDVHFMRSHNRIIFQNTSKRKIIDGLGMYMTV